MGVLSGEWFRVIGAMTTRLSMVRDFKEKGLKRLSIADTDYLLALRGGWGWGSPSTIKYWPCHHKGGETIANPGLTRHGLTETAHANEG